MVSEALSWILKDSVNTSMTLHYIMIFFLLAVPKAVNVNTYF